MRVRTIGLVGVGAMGAGIGGSLVAAGSRVVAVLSDRTVASRARAAEAGIEGVDDLPALIAQSDIVLSIVPPGVASAVADETARAAENLGAEGTGIEGTVFVDCNAISPGRSRQIAATLDTVGLRYVDGGLIGAPPSPGRPTALYLSGEGGDVVADALRTPEIRAEWLGPEPAAAASALKISYAAWTKGLNALVLSIRALAQAEGVDAALIAEWQRSQPAALAAVDRAPATAEKAWRWVAEMQEIATSLDEAGLPGGAFLSAAEVYRRLERYKDIGEPPTVDEMLDALGYLPPITPGT
jgi:3-hydroxyisobutyrate dehydrogenase-like beta-hydroxyacid dehydrogenase